MENTLENQRRVAAEASRGISNDSVYLMAMKVITEHNLGGELLEFGAGTGSLISDLVTSGYPAPITGADILPRPAGLPEEIRWIQADLNQPLDLPDGVFDSIISTEVIEHLENPRAIFREFFRLLKPSGKLLVTTPNQASLRSLISVVLDGHFVAFRDDSYPAHITALLRKDFERICRETGFAGPQFFFSNAGAIPKVPHLRWQRFSPGLFSGRLFSDNFAMLATKVAE